MRRLMTLPLLVLEQHVPFPMSIRDHLRIILLRSDIFLIVVFSGIREVCEMHYNWFLFGLAYD